MSDADELTPAELGDEHLETSGPEGGGPVTGEAEPGAGDTGDGDPGGSPTTDEITLDKDPEVADHLDGPDIQHPTNWRIS